MLDHALDVSRGNVLVDRIDLGSGVKKRLGKEDLIRMFRQGMTNDEVLEQCNGSFTKGQIAAYKANYTRGAYD